MKISIFTYSVTRSAGGVFDAVRDLFLSKEMNGHDLTVFSFFDDENKDNYAYWKGIPLKLYKGGFMLSSPKAKKALFLHNADILHMEGLWRWPHLWMGDWKERIRKPIVCSPHGMLDPWIVKNQGWLKRFISSLFFQKGLDSVTVYHALCQKELDDIRIYGLMQPIAVIPNGINMPSDDTVSRINALLPKDDKKHLLYLGRLHKKKGVDLLLLALADIKRNNPELLRNWQIDLVGWDDEGCRCKLEKIVDENCLDNVVFHGGKFGDDKLLLHAQASGYILPSHGEGLPMTVLEAWAWHLPVIMTPQCHIPEGFIADAAIKIDDTIDSCMEGLMKFFSMTDEEREAMGDRGYELVARDFTWDAAAKKMVELYEWLLGKREKPEFVYE